MLIDENERSNVVCFPIERRRDISVAVLRRVQPDVQEVEGILEAFFLPRPPRNLRLRADAAMAERIVDDLPIEEGLERRFMLNQLEQTVLIVAIDTCRRAREQERLAEAALDAWCDRLKPGEAFIWHPAKGQSANDIAKLILNAYAAAQEAYGALRAIRLAREGKLWTRPKQVKENMARPTIFGEYDYGLD